MSRAFQAESFLIQANEIQVDMYRSCAGYVFLPSRSVRSHFSSKRKHLPAFFLVHVLSGSIGPSTARRKLPVGLGNEAALTFSARRAQTHPSISAARR